MGCGASSNAPGGMDASKSPPAKRPAFIREEARAHCLQSLEALKPADTWAADTLTRLAAAEPKAAELIGANQAKVASALAEDGALPAPNALKRGASARAPLRVKMQGLQSLTALNVDASKATRTQRCIPVQ